MFKSGVKRLFLVLSLVFCSGLIFSACGKDKVEVSSIHFIETDVIKMVVGQTYQPGITVLPSYADNKDYYFEVVSATNSLEIKGKKILAINEGTAQLKVVSESDEMINDVISVKVLPEAVQLQNPEDLKFDGEIFSFSSVEDALAYKIKIVGEGVEEEINLGNTTFYSLSQLEKKTMASQTGKVLTVNVKAVGDEVVSLSSSYDTSKEIKVLKAESVKSPIIENNVLKFEKIEGVANYNLTFAQNGQQIVAVQINQESYVGDYIEFDMASQISNFEGGDYSCSLVASSEGYQTESGVKVFASNESKLAVKILGVPKNLKLSNYVLYWDKVVGADSYAIYNAQNELVVDNVETCSYDLTELELDTRNAFKVVAKSLTNKNVVSGINFTNVVEFEKLSAPTDLLEENRVLSWQKVGNAKGYRIEITNLDGTVVVDKNLSGGETSSYDVSALGEGSYSYKVYSLGNGVDVLDSLDYSESSFEVLAKVQELKISNRVISWQSSCDEFELEIYNSTRGEEFVTLDLTSADNSISEGVIGYSLVGTVIDGGSYQVRVKAKGEGNLFDSQISTINFYKLSAIQNLDINDCEIGFQTDIRTVDTKITYKKVGEDLVRELEKQSLTSFVIDGNMLSAGKYELQVYVYGNNANILDDGETPAGTKEFIKLESPTFEIDTTTRELVRVDDVNNAVAYTIYRNGEKYIDMSTSNYVLPIGEVEQGEYHYTFKSVGNSKDRLDSNVSLSSIKVLKLDMPTINFVKKDVENNVYEINIVTAQESYVESYEVKLNGVIQTVGEGSGDVDATVTCTDKFVEVGEHIIEAQLLRTETSADFDLVLQSDVNSLIVEKINAESRLDLNNGDLCIYPDATALNESVRLKLLIEFGQNKVTYTNAVLDESAYYVDVIDDNYNFVGPLLNGKAVFGLANNFSLTAVYETTDELKINNQCTLPNVSVLDKVANIRKTSEIVENVTKEYISFDEVAGAGGYMLEIVSGGTSYYINVNSSQLAIDEVVRLFNEQGLEFKQNATYSLKVVALGEDDNYTISSKSDEVFELAFLSNPTLSLIEEGTNKQLSILNNVEIVESYEISFSDYKMVVDKSDDEYTLVDLPELTAGEVDVVVVPLSSTNVFKGNGATTSYTQLESPSIAVQDGYLVWSLVDNAVSYLLEYSVGGETSSVSLTSQNYTTKNGVAYYGLPIVEMGATGIKMKAISTLKSGANYYNNSAFSDAFTVYKLSKPAYTVEGGEIVVSIPSNEVAYISKIVIVSNGQNLDIIQQGLVTEISAKMVIAPEKLLQYTTETTIAVETFEMYAIAKEYEDGDSYYCLDSNKQTFECQGLKVVEDLGVEMTENYESAQAGSVDKIRWTNNTLNDGKVVGYYFVITYNEKEYTYTVNLPSLNNITFPTDPEFASGEYRIKVKVLASASSGYLNSKFSEEFVIVVCDQVSGLTTEKGELVWSSTSNAQKYIVRIYSATEGADGKEKGTLIKTVVKSETKLDFSTISDLTTDLYFVTAQAINEANPDVASGAESEPLQIVRLPAVKSYYLNMGELYIKHHKYVSELKISLSGVSEPLYYETDCQIATCVTGFSNWASYDNFDADFDGDDDYVETVIGEEHDVVATILSIIEVASDSYTLNVTAVGTTSTSFATVNSMAVTSENVNVFGNSNDATATSLQKLGAPTIALSEKGKVTWSYASLPSTNYKGLEGYLIYDVVIEAGGGAFVGGNKHNFYVIDNIDLTDIDALKTATGIEDVHVFSDYENHTYYGYLKYEDIYINILRYTKTKVDAEGNPVLDENGAEVKETLGELKIDFTENTLYYIDKYGTVDGLNNSVAKTNSISLIDGGNFNVKVSVTGDDTIYLSSNFSNIVTLTRYSQLTLSEEDGYLTFENIIGDKSNAVYLLTITDETDEEYYVYLYNQDYDFEFNANLTNVEGKTFKHPIDYKLSTIEYMFDTINEASYLFNEGIYSVNVSVLALNEMAYAILDSKASPTIEVIKLARTTASLSTDGKLSFSQVGVYNKDDTYVYDYEIVASNGSENVTFRIASKDYKLTSGTIYYELQGAVVDVDGENFTFDSYSSWNFSVKALAVGYDFYINANESDLLESVEITQMVTNVRAENNKILWDDAENGKYKVKIEFEIGDEKVKIETAHLTNKYFEFTEEELTDVKGVGRLLSSDYVYSISVMKIGSSEILSSFYTEAIKCEKIDKVNTSSINYREDGYVEWSVPTNLDGVAITDVVYELKITGVADVVTLTEPFYNFEGMSGEIEFKINIKHLSYFKSADSDVFAVFESKYTDAITMYKYGKVGSITPNEGNVINTLNWDAVLVNGVYADIYEVELKDDSEQAEYKTVEREEGKTTISFNVEGITLTNIKIRIRAINDDASQNYLSSDWSGERVFEKAEGIDINYFRIEDYKIKFQGRADATEDDSYVLSYEWLSLDGSEYKNPTYEFAYSDGVDDGTGVLTYEYPIIEIGVYYNISVVVSRLGGVLSSDSVVMKNLDQEDDNYNEEMKYNFNLFSSGDGSETNPYCINDVDEFKNINLFLDANYKLINSIEFNNEDIGIAITGEFTGTLNGNSNIIQNFTLTTTENYSAIFKKMSGAIISNLTITGTRVNITHNYDASSKLYGGILVAMADNCEFNNISITNTLLNVKVVDESTIDNSNLSRFYYGGIAGYISNSNITSCNISLTDTDKVDQTVQLYNQIEILGYTRDIVYYGGVAGYAIDTNIGNDETQSIVTVYYQTDISYDQTSHSTYPMLYFGGVLGVMASAVQTSEPTNYINNVIVTVNQSSIFAGEISYNGGVVGYASCGVIKSVVVAGTIGVNASASGKSTIYLGKIVANFGAGMVKLESNTDNGLTLLGVKGTYLVINEDIDL